MLDKCCTSGNQINRTSVLLAAVLLAGATLAGGAPVQAVVTDCIELGFFENPLWIGEVELALLDGDDHSLVAGATPFVTAGDVLAVSFTVENRAPEECGTLQPLIGTDTLHVTVNRAYPAAAGSGWTEVRECGDRLARGGGTCQVTDTIEVADGALGEQVLRYVAGVPDDDEYTAVIGAERVLVLDARPEPSPAGLTWTDPLEDRHTAYGEHAWSLFDLAVENSGTYPWWDPNGGDLYWGRSSYDAPGDGDESPDDRAADGSQQAIIREAPYTRTSSQLPPCIGPAWMTAGGPGTHTNTDRLTCSYKRGERPSLPATYEVRPVGSADPVENGTYDLYPEPSVPAHDKDDALAHAGNEAGLPNAKVHELRIMDRLKRAGLHNVEVRLEPSAASAAGSLDPITSNNVIDGAFDIHGVDLELVAPGVSVVDGLLRVSAGYRNAGDALADDTDATMPDWKAAIYVNDQLVTYDAAGNDAAAHLPNVTATTDGVTELWPGGIDILPDPTSSLQRVEVRLDHPDNYQNDGGVAPSADKGRVVERVEHTELAPPSCTGATSGISNIFCDEVSIGSSGTQLVNAGTDVIEIIMALVNNKTTLRGEHAPSYLGLASEPDNWFRLEATIDDEADPAPFDPDGKHAIVHDTTGTLAAELPVGVIVSCKLSPAVDTPLVVEESARGEDCADENGDGQSDTRPLYQVSDVEPIYYADTREHPWNGTELGWVGNFTLGLSFADDQGATHARVLDAELRDVDGPASLAHVLVRPTTVDPGQAIEISAEAADGLRVETVVALITRPDNTSVSVPLAAKDLDDLETRSGLYRTLVSTGPGTVLDQEGAYELAVVATDFAGKTTQVRTTGFYLTSDGLQLELPDAPGALAAIGKPLRVQLSWDEPADTGGAQVLHYTVYRAGADCTGLEPVGLSAGDAGLFVDPTAEPGTTYCYQVTATNVVGEGDPSVTVFGEALHPPDLVVAGIEAVKPTIRTDLAAFVPNPWAGQTIEIDVANVGPTPTEGRAIVTVTICPQEPSEPYPELTAACETLATWHLDEMADGATETRTTHWDTWGLVGDFDVCVDVSYELPEATGANNADCSRTFVAVGGTGIGGVQLVGDVA